MKAEIIKGNPEQMAVETDLVSESAPSPSDGGENPPDYVRAWRPVTSSAQTVDDHQWSFAVTGRGAQ